MYTLALNMLPDWLNYPGLELWKFLNLAVFIGVGVFLLRDRIREALRARGDRIRGELLEAEEQKKEALKLLEEAEGLLARLDTDIAEIRQHAKTEAASERQRLAESTANEIEKLQLQ